MNRPKLLFHGDDVVPSPPREALFHVIPVPLERSVSYGTGTAAGPEAILEASAQLEVFNGRGQPAEQGIYTAAPVLCTGTWDEVRFNIRAAVAEPLKLGKIPVVLGGEHTLTGAVVEAVRDYHQEFGVIQFDAHADLRDTYDGTPYSHACVMRRIHEQAIPILQLGTRSYSLEEHHYRLHHRIPYLDSETIWRNGPVLELPPEFPEKIYLSFDVDGLDSAVMPATGTPVPGGLTWYQAMQLIETVLAGRVCIGFDVVEFAPIEVLPAPSFTAAQLVYNLMGLLSASTINRDFHGC